MNSKRDLQIASLLIIVLLIAGITCYAAFPPSVPKQPVRIMFQTSAGKVLFGHASHVADYDLSCEECHHNLDDEKTYKCSDCHEKTGDDDMPSLSDAMHTKCKGCHEDNGSGPVECNSCHVL